MASILAKLFKTSAKTDQHADELDFNRLPVFDAESLIRFCGQQNRIRKIQRLVQIDAERFQLLYLDVIHNFAELVQLMPASQAHHHAVPGGLFIHTLEVIESALMVRQKYKLPAFATPEIQEKQRHVWTYAIFCAAILHDIGKRVTMVRFIVNEREFSAFESKRISDCGSNYYQIVFNDSKYYEMHESIGLSFIDIFPSVGRSFIFSYLAVVKEMSAFIHGDKENQGIIGKILTEADRLSTGKSLAHSTTRKFKKANLENIGERLMTEFRTMLASNDFVVNKSNANIYTTNQGYAYAVSKILADSIRESMSKDGNTDIPKDNNRIFDIFQEYGFAETNPINGKIIHTIRLHKDGNTRVFTVLKFQVSKLFRVIPEPYQGMLEEIESKNSPVAEASRLREESITEPAIRKETVADDLEDQETVAVTDDPFVNAKSDTNEDNFANQIVAKSQPIARSQSKTKETVADDKQHMADGFLDWCRFQLHEKHIIVNESGSQIQLLNYKKQVVVGLVTPRIFADYASHLGLKSPTDKSTFSKIQNAIHQRKLNIKSFKGQIHRYNILKSHNNPLNGHGSILYYLFTVQSFCQGDEIMREILEKMETNSNLKLNSK